MITQLQLINIIIIIIIDKRQWQVKTTRKLSQCGLLCYDTVWTPMFWKDILPPCSSVKCKWGREVKVDPLHTIKIYRGNKGTAPLILKLGTRWSQAENSLHPDWIRIPYRPVHSLVNNAVNGGCSSKAVGTIYQLTVSHLSKSHIIHKTAQCYNILSQQAVSAGTDKPVRE